MKPSNIVLFITGKKYDFCKSHFKIEQPFSVDLEHITNQTIHTSKYFSDGITPTRAVLECGTHSTGLIVIITIIKYLKQFP